MTSLKLQKQVGKRNEHKRRWYHFTYTALQFPPKVIISIWSISLIPTRLARWSDATLEKNIFVLQ